MVAVDGARCAGVFGLDDLLDGASTSVPLVLTTSACTQISQCCIIWTFTKFSASPSYVSHAGATANCTFASANGPGF